jgi:hypothetical protein
MLKEIVELSLYLAGTCFGIVVGYNLIRYNTNNANSDDLEENEDIDKAESVSYFVDDELSNIDENIKNAIECNIDASKYI